MALASNILQSLCRQLTLALYQVEYLPMDFADSRSVAFALLLALSSVTRHSSALCLMMVGWEGEDSFNWDSEQTHEPHTYQYVHLIFAAPGTLHWFLFALDASRQSPMVIPARLFAFLQDLRPYSDQVIGGDHLITSAQRGWGPDVHSIMTACFGSLGSVSFRAVVLCFFFVYPCYCAPVVLGVRYLKYPPSSISLFFFFQSIRLARHDSYPL